MHPNQYLIIYQIKSNGTLKRVLYPLNASDSTLLYGVVISIIMWWTLIHVDKNFTSHHDNNPTQLTNPNPTN